MTNIARQSARFAHGGAHARIASWCKRVGAATALALVAMACVSGSAGAAVVLGRSGNQTGYVDGYGAAACNPMSNGGVASQYVEITGPRVTGTPYYNYTGYTAIGGNDSQSISWAPMLQKYDPATGAWNNVWSSGWLPRSSITQDFPLQWVNVYNLKDKYGRAIGGPGYYRVEGYVYWAPDAHHYGGADHYRLSNWPSGDYFTGGWANGLTISGGTRLSTPYCYIG